MLSCVENLGNSFTLNISRSFSYLSFKYNEQGYPTRRKMENCWNYNCFYFSLMEIALKSMGGKSNLKESSIRKHTIMYSEYFFNDGKIQNTWRGASVTIFSIRWADIVHCYWVLLWPRRQSRSGFIFVFWTGVRAQYHWWRWDHVPETTHAIWFSIRILLLRIIKGW